MYVTRYTAPASLAAEGLTDAPPTADAAAEMIGDWHDLSPTQRRDLASALSVVVKMCRRAEAWALQEGTVGNGGQVSPVAVPMDCAFFSERLFARPPSAFELTPQRHANVLSGLRTILRRLGRHAPAQRGLDHLTADWRRCYDALPSEHRRLALSGFMKFCGQQGILPRDVAPSTLADFELWCRQNLLCKNVVTRVRQVIASWNWARLHVSDWPAVELHRPGIRQQYTLRFEAFPPSFQADVAEFQRRIACDDPDLIFSDDIFDQGGRASSRRRPARPATVRTRVAQLRMAAAALVRSGHAPESVVSLRTLVVPPENAKAIISFFWDRAGRKPTSMTAGITECLRQVALHHCGLPADQVARIARWGRKVAPDRRAGMTPKNRARLRALMVLRNRARLLHLPRRLMERAGQPATRPKEAALLAAPGGGDRDPARLPDAPAQSDNVAAPPQSAAVRSARAAVQPHRARGARGQERAVDDLADTARECPANRDLFEQNSAL